MSILSENNGTTPPLPFASGHRGRSILLTGAVLLLPACTTVGSLMSPYSEKFSCKNSDHGQCIHPDKAYADAIADMPSRSDPAVTNDKAMLHNKANSPASSGAGKRRNSDAAPFNGYRDSVYRELQGLVEAPITPMLRPGRTVRTLILPYADRERPDRLYMPRYVYAILERPQWVVGDYLVNPVQPAARVPILEQIRERPSVDRASQGEPAAVPALPAEAKP